MFKKIFLYIKFFLIYSVIILYSLEFLTIIFLGKKYNLATKTFDQWRYEKSLEIKNFDMRTGVQAFIEEKKKNSNLSPTYRFSVSEWHLDAVDHQNKIRNFLNNKIEKKEIVPFKGPINKQTLGSGEDGHRRTTYNDKYGFQNPNYVYQKEIDIMIIGDSFAEGVPFSEKDDIAGRIRKNGNLNAINYGISGAGPLLSLAVLSEYGSFFSPKKVYYLFFEGNDMDDLITEKNSFLVNYLSDYTQNLYKNHDKVKIFLEDYERIIYEILPYKDKSNRIVKKTQNKFYENLKDFLELSSLKDILFSRSFHSFKEKEDPELMVSVLKKMKKITEGWDGEINFVYIPSWHRYNQKFSFANYSYKKKIRNLSSLSKIKFIDLVEVFASQNIEPLNLYNFGLHFNDKGYEIISNTIVKDF
mgnify:FL=1|jgi:hypothetical protein|tara:strand:- start:375 stop:1616 length:1242 start_codon:yes stop_codon:yes gene_type:complete